MAAERNGSENDLMRPLNRAYTHGPDDDPQVKMTHGTGTGDLLDSMPSDLGARPAAFTQVRALLESQHCNRRFWPNDPYW